MNPFLKAFTPEKLSEAWEIVVRDFPHELWVTLYITLLSTLFAIIIGLPLGVLLVTGEENGIRPLPKPPKDRHSLVPVVASFCV